MAEIRASRSACRPATKILCNLLASMRCGRLAFPAISTGVYGYPKQAATKIALEAMRGGVNDFERIIACCFSSSDVGRYVRLCSECEVEKE